MKRPMITVFCREYTWWRELTDVAFSTLTKETLDFEAPYDERFRDFMIDTIKHLMKCGFRVRFAYSQSDEINLLFDINETAFSRKLRKYNSVLAAEASAVFP